MSFQSPELTNNMAIWRAKVIDGTITPEEMKQAIIMMRADRLGAQAANAASGSKSRSKAPARSADDMLAEL